MTGYEEMLAQLEAAEAAMREQHGERITRITISPTLTPWLRRKFPAVEPPLIPSPWAGLTGIPIVEDPSFAPGRLRIHRGGETEDWFAVPAAEPERLVRINEAAVEFPQVPFEPPSWINIVADERIPPGCAVAVNAAGKPHMLTGIGAPRRPWWRRVFRRR